MAGINPSAHGACWTRYSLRFLCGGGNRDPPSLMKTLSAFVLSALKLQGTFQGTNWTGGVPDPSSGTSLVGLGTGEMAPQLKACSALAED